MGTSAMAEPAVAASMTAHATKVKANQSAARRAAKPPTTTSTKPDARLASLVAWRKTAEAPSEVLEVVDAVIRRGSATPRATMAKADPKEVAAFFKSTGLSMKAIAEAVGVSTSVVSTVQRESGDRWSVQRYLAATELILAAVKKAAVKAVK